MEATTNQRCPGFEQALIVVPQLFICPFCGSEIEIWTDEKRARCVDCGKMVSREGASSVDVGGEREPPSKDAQRGGEPGVAGPDNGVQCGQAVNEPSVEVLEHADDFGAILFYEKHERVVEVNAIVHGERYKESCHLCPRFGKNLACPPHSPTFAEYLQGMKKAKVLCIRVPQEYFTHLPFEERSRACFRRARRLLSELLLEYRGKGHLIAGSGPCLACEECALAAGSDRCEKPEVRIYSLESLGVNVVGLVTRHFGIDLEWSVDERHADFVCAVGAICLS